MTLVARIRHYIADNQILIVLVAIILGITFPNLFQQFAAYTTPMLMMIFFTSSLRLRLHDMARNIRDVRMLLIANGVMLVLMPVLLWIPPTLFAPDWALAFLIVGVVPTGITVALIADLFGGDMSLAMLVSATTSLLSPITIPLVLTLIVGRTIEIPVVQLFGSLVLSIVLPFLLAVFIKSKARALVEKSDLIWREISLALFALLIAGIVADTMHESTLHLGWSELGMVITMLICLGGIAWLAYSLASWRKPNERITLALCMVYMNNTLALYIGDTFFHEQNVVPKLILILTAVNALLPIIKWLALRATKASKRQLTSRVAHPIL